MKVVALTHSIAPQAAGMFFAIRDLCGTLRASGVDVRVLALHGADSDVEREWPSTPVELFAVGQAMRRGARLLQALNRHAPDVVHLHGIWSPLSLATRYCQITAKGPVVVSPHGMLDPWALQQKRWKKAPALTLIERANLNNAACVVALNEAEAEAIRQLRVRAPVAVIPNGAPVPNIAGAENRNDPSVNNPVGAPYILFLGRIAPKKGVAELVEAIRILKNTDTPALPDLKLVVAGWNDNAYATGIRADVDRQGLSGSVVFTGPVFGEAKAALLRHARAFVLPSYSEGLPMAVLEAWSYAVPTFLTRQCNVAEAFAAGAAIEISTAPAEIASVLASHLADPAALERIGQASRQLVERRHRWEAVSQRYIRLYQWLVGDMDRPDFVV